MLYIKHIILSVLLFFISGCVFTTTQVDPELCFSNSIESAKQASEMFAAMKNGKSHHIVGYGSMLPTIHDNDYVVTVPIDILKNNMLGRIVVYKTIHSNVPLCQRIIGHDLWGYIAKGDNNNRPDYDIRVTNENCLGEVIAIFRPQ